MHLCRLEVRLARQGEMGSSEQIAALEVPIVTPIPISHNLTILQGLWAFCCLFFLGFVFFLLAHEKTFKAVSQVISAGFRRKAEWEL